MPSFTLAPSDLTSYPWHTLSPERVSEILCSDMRGGLLPDDARHRLVLHGANQLKGGSGASALHILFQQCKNTLIVILLFAVILSAFLGHDIEAVAIGLIVFFAIGLGFAQEYRAEKAIDALRSMVAPLATVMRGGQSIDVPASDLVPGDVILLSAGDKVPADARIFDIANLSVNESSLTGESAPVEKSIVALSDPALSVGDRRSMVFSGTSVTYGRGKALVTGTGMMTEFGSIATMLQSVETQETPLQRNLDHVGKVLAKAALVGVFFISGIGYLRGQPLLDMIIFGIALAVAVVPEALPAVVTISLAIGVQRMVKRHALMRRLPAVETLGSTTVICTDKTGTLTKDEMTVRLVYAGGDEFELGGVGYEPKGSFTLAGAPVSVLTDDLRACLLAAVLVNDATVVQHDGLWDIQGDPTEGALVVAAMKAGLDKKLLDASFPRTKEIPFTSETKRMTTFHASESGTVVYAKGAPEIIVAACSSMRLHGEIVPLDQALRENLLSRAQSMADNALRVLALAVRSDENMDSVDEGMIFLGFVGMIDPPRPEAKKAVMQCHDAGIKVVMITGDHPATAMAVARELRISVSGRMVTGQELDAMNDTSFEQEIERIDVYARVSPAHKLRVVTAFQKRGHIVAMTGDGVNDAPALKKADIGIAMGLTGTDVSKEAAAMTLTDDNFASIVAAVEEGRGIFGNIKKYLMYLLSSNIGEIGLMAGATLAGIPLPLTAVQILYVNLATDGLPALALAVDPPERDLMSRLPRENGSGIFTRPVLVLMLVGGLWSTFVNFVVFWGALHFGIPLKEAMSMTFVCLVLIQFFKAYNFRSDRHTILSRPFANAWLNHSIFWESILLIFIIHAPLLQGIFGTSSLTVFEWIIILLLSATVIPVLEATKYCVRHCFFSMNS